MTDVVNTADQVVHQNQEQNREADLLSLIKNDSGKPKYASLEDALNSVAHSQTHIATLEGEARQKDQVISEQESKIRELAEQVQTLEAAKNYLEKVSTQVDNTNTQADQPQIFDESKLAELVQRQLQTVEINRMRQANLDKVFATLSEAHGENVGQIVQAGMQKFNFSEQQVKDLASENPDAFLELFNKKPTATSPLKSTVTAPAPTVPLDSDKPKLTGKTMKDKVAYIQSLRQSVHAKHGIS